MTFDKKIQFLRKENRMSQEQLSETLKNMRVLLLQNTESVFLNQNNPINTIYFRVCFKKYALWHQPLKHSHMFYWFFSLPFMKFVSSDKLYRISWFTSSELKFEIVLPGILIHNVHCSPSNLLLNSFLC